MRIRSRKNRAAFTLIELVLVAAIIAIMTAIAVPRYANAINNYRVNGIARRLCADITLAQWRARSLSTSQSITFQIAQNQYQIVGMPDPDRAASTYTTSLTDNTLPGTLVSASFAASPTLTFNGYGVPNAAGTVQVKSGNAVLTVAVEAFTGKATVQ